MIHVGVDLHQRFCYMTALDARGKILQSGPVTNEKSGVAEVFPVVSRAGGAGGGGGLRVLAGVSRGGGAGGAAVGAGASAAGEGDRFGEVEERSGGLRDAGAFVALRFAARVVEGGPGDAGAAAAGTVADNAGAAADAAEEPGARGAASAGAALAGDAICSASAGACGWPR